MLQTKIAVLQSHPIQYFSPLWAKLSRNKRIAVKVYYCSDSSIKGLLDKQFGQNVKWDIPLLDGYEYQFLKNYSPRPSVTTKFWGLMNWGIFNRLKKDRPDIIIIHGWAYFTNFIAFFSAKYLGIKVWLRSESPLNQELKKARWKRVLKRIFLQHIFFHWVSRFLYIGEQNRRFYRFYNVTDEKMIFSPYCVDNERFKNEYKKLKVQKEWLKENYNIPENHRIVLFSGKFIRKKRPLDLLQAFKMLKTKNVTLIMVGEGELRTKMENFIEKHSLQNILLTGFVNQSEISNFYAMADVFVLPSAMGETWGLVVNEAMNFHLPLIVSDDVGSATDLVEEGKNGYTYPVGNIDNLSEKLTNILEMSIKQRSEMGEKSARIVKKYSYQTIENNMIDQLMP